MKNLKITSVFILIVLGCLQPVEAQFWKKLGKRVEKAAKETVIRKVEDKAVDKTERTMDTILNADKKVKRKRKNKKGVLSSTTISPSHYYDFTHKYVMQMEDKKGVVDFEYLLIDGGNYLGIKMPMNGQEMITIMDIQKQTAFMLMKNGNQKMLMTMGLNFEDVASETNQEYDVQVNKTNHTKDILGYSCTEYKVKGEGFKGSVWITQDADITFPKSFYKMKDKRFKKTQSMDQSWIANMNGLTMEMDIIDTSKKKEKHIKMKCILLERQDFSVDTSGYKKMM